MFEFFNKTLDNVPTNLTDAINSKIDQNVLPTTVIGGDRLIMINKIAVWLLPEKDAQIWNNISFQLRDVIQTDTITDTIKKIITNNDIDKYDKMKQIMKLAINQQMGPLITKFIASEKIKEASKTLQEQMKDDIYNYLTDKASLKDLLTLVRDDDGNVIDSTVCNKGPEGLLCYREMFF